MVRSLTFLMTVLAVAAASGCTFARTLSGDCALNDDIYPKPEPDYDGKRARDLSPFAAALDRFSAERAAELEALLQGKTVLDIQELLDAGDLSSEELVTYYVERIQRYDIDRLNAVLELNPEALAIARTLDEERAAGSVRGDMHGIPVLLKDNIATGDGLHAAAGAAALANWQPDRDARLVQQLRQNGAIILGKANLSEWANWMDSCMPNGFSALGGQTQNAYGPYDPSGSSSGSAVAAAANLATVAVGSETQGSLISPAENNGVVALKTSLGLVSGDYIIPLLPAQDVPGPIGRSVTDVAVLLSAMTGGEPGGGSGADAAELVSGGFRQYLSPEAAQGLRVGLALESEEENERVGQILRAAGFEVVDVAAEDVPRQGRLAPVLTPGYKRAIDEFLSSLGDQAPVSSLQEIVDFNKEDLDNRAPHGQDHLEDSLASDISDEEFAEMVADLTGKAQTGLDTLFETAGIDVLVNNRTQAYAQAGYPALTVPAGLDEDGQPRGITLIGRYLGEPALIAAGHALEQGLQGRVEPDLGATMQLIDALTASAGD